MRRVWLGCAAVLLAGGCEQPRATTGPAAMPAVSWEVSTRTSAQVRAVWTDESTRDPDAPFVGIGAWPGDDGKVPALVRLTLNGQGNADVSVEAGAAGDSYVIAWRWRPHVTTNRVATGSIGLREDREGRTEPESSFGVLMQSDVHLVVVPNGWAEGVRVRARGGNDAPVTLLPGQYVEARADGDNPANTLLGEVRSLNSDAPGPAEAFAEFLERLKSETNPTADPGAPRTPGGPAGGG